MMEQTKGGALDRTVSKRVKHGTYFGNELVPRPRRMALMNLYLHYKLDITWLKYESLEDAYELPEPQDLAAEAITELEAVVDDFREMLTLLEQSASEVLAS